MFLILKMLKILYLTQKYRVYSDNNIFRKFNLDDMHTNNFLKDYKILGTKNDENDIKQAI